MPATVLPAAPEATPAPMTRASDEGQTARAISRRIELWCIWCIPAVLVTLFGGMLIAGLVPPPSPAWSPERVADFWATNPDQKRFGIVLIFLAGILTGPLCVPISARLRQIPGAGPLATIQLIGGALSVPVIVIPSLIFAVVAFRPGRDPEIVQALSDLGLLAFIVNISGAMLQAVAIGAAVLLQKGGTSVLPRWLGYFNLWAAVAYLPGLALVFFTDGALAWNGAVPFWLVAVEFGVWYLVLFWVFRRALLEEDA